MKQQKIVCFQENFEIKFKQNITFDEPQTFSKFKKVFKYIMTLFTYLVFQEVLFTKSDNKIYVKEFQLLKKIFILDKN